MRFSIQGYIVDTSDKTVEEKIGEYLMLLVCVYFPHIKVDKVCYKYNFLDNIKNYMVLDSIFQT